MEKFAKRLRELREEKGISQRKIAPIFGISQSSYGDYELNISEPSLDMLIKIAEFFGVTVDYLLGREDYSG